MTCNLFYCFFFSFIFSTLNAQGGKEPFVQTYDKGWSIGFTPSAMLTFNPNLQFSASYRFKKHFESNTELGGFLYSRGPFNMTKGVLRTELKTYPFGKAFYISTGYYGIFFKGSSDQFYTYRSLDYEKKFQIDRLNYQNYFVFGFGKKYSFNEKFFVAVGSRIGLGTVNGKGDKIPPDFFNTSSQNWIEDEANIFKENYGKEDSGFWHLSLNISYFIGE